MDEKTIHMGKVRSTTNKYQILFDGTNFGSLQIVVRKNLFNQYCFALYGFQL